MHARTSRLQPAYLGWELAELVSASQSARLTMQKLLPLKLVLRGQASLPAASCYGSVMRQLCSILTH